MSKIKTVIVDDEARARNLLTSVLTKFVDEIEIVGTADSVAQAITVIDKVNPDLVFLDIQMPGGNGFTLFDHYEGKQKFEVILTTAYDKYAIEAIKKAALDYIMKPVEMEELQEALERFKTRRKASNGEPQESFVVLDYESAGRQDVKISIVNVKGFELVSIKCIMYCNAASNYCEFHLTDGRILIASQTLKFFSEKLLQYGFYRVHDSYLVNISKIVKYTAGRKGTIEVVDGTVLPVSRSKKVGLLELISG